MDKPPPTAPRENRCPCLQMTLRNPLVGAWAGRYPPSRRSHKRLLSHRWTVQAYPGDGGDDANAPESGACLHVDYGHPRQPAENHLRRGARVVRAGCSCTARTTAAATRSPSVQIDSPPPRPAPSRGRRLRCWKPVARKPRSERLQDKVEIEPNSAPFPLGKGAPNRRRAPRRARAALVR